MLRRAGKAEVLLLTLLAFVLGAVVAAVFIRAGLGAQLPLLVGAAVVGYSGGLLYLLRRG